MPLAGQRDAVVVDDDGGAVARELERVRPTDPAARAGDDRDAAFEEAVGHEVLLDQQEGGCLSPAVTGHGRPETYDARSLARNAATLPTSSGRAIRPIGMVRSIAATDACRRSGRRSARCGTARRRSSSRAPSGAHSIASEVVGGSRQALAAAYAAMVGAGQASQRSRDVHDEPPEAWCCITALAAWEHSRGDSRLRPTTSRGSAGTRSPRRPRVLPRRC